MTAQGKEKHTVNREEHIMNENKRAGMAASFPLFVGAVVAAAAAAQENWGGAALGLVAGVVISLILVARRRKR